MPRWSVQTSERTRANDSICNWMRLMLNFLQIYNEKRQCHQDTLTAQHNSAMHGTFASFPLSLRYCVLLRSWMDRVKIINCIFNLQNEPPQLAAHTLCVYKREPKTIQIWRKKIRNRFATSRDSGRYGIIGRRGSVHLVASWNFIRT